MNFSITLTTVAVMLAYAVPGYLLAKTGKLKKDAMSVFATLLLYVASPFQTVYAMQQIEYSAYMVKYLAISFVLGFVFLGGLMSLSYFLFRKKQTDASYRIYTVAFTMGNFGFFGLPLLEALLPEYPQMIAFAAMFFVAFNVLMWTLTSFIITRNKQYISVKKVLLNPSIIAMAVSLVFFFGRIRFTGQVKGMVELLGKMATPLCMLILGMRLSMTSMKVILSKPMHYVCAAMRLILYPLIVLGICRLLPLEENYIRGMYLLSCVPVGALVLTFAEMLNEGQETALSVVLLSTILSIFTIPVMILLV